MTLVVEKTMASKTVSKSARVADNDGMAGEVRVMEEGDSEEGAIHCSNLVKLITKPNDGPQRVLDRNNKADRGLRCEIETKRVSVSPPTHLHVVCASEGHFLTNKGPHPTSYRRTKAHPRSNLSINQSA